MTKYIVVTGGTLSGLGKGATTAAMARLLSDENRLVTIKCDGYFNVDPGTMNPFEHGEVFVLDDGGEVDMDFGNYERFLNINSKSSWNLTSGKMLSELIEKERKGDYLGATVQYDPHLIELIRDRFIQVGEDENADVVMIEIGGTINDNENAWFIDAAKILKQEVGQDNIMYAHLTFVPYLNNVGEIKTRIAQEDLADIRKRGINPDIVFCRGEQSLDQKIKEKIARKCGLGLERVISAEDVETIYELPLNYEKQGILEIIEEKLNLPAKVNLKKWKSYVDRIKNPYNKAKIAICGKYTGLQDSYASIIESLRIAGAHLDCAVDIVWTETTDKNSIESSLDEIMYDVNGIIVPGGFGGRGTEGKIRVIQYARENNIPYLGLCLGLQMAVAEYARNVCGLEGANSTEADSKTEFPVVDIMPDQAKLKTKGGNMRLGAYEARIKPKTIVNRLYKKEETISERHRHRYEVNPSYHQLLQANGLVFSGTSQNGLLVEFIELKSHPYFVATQAHPEFKSRMEKPSPLFYGLVKAAMNNHKL